MCRCFDVINKKAGFTYRYIPISAVTGVRNQEMKLDLINFYVAFLMDECTVVCTLFNVVISSCLKILLRIE